ncbi:MAG: hypothetical protein HS111_03640 [Kofleriaceae bacterium]|nr:hypothetical protein [Kofleriaceae bacterium]
MGAVYHTYDPFGRARTTYRYDGYPHAVRSTDYTRAGPARVPAARHRRDHRRRRLQSTTPPAGWRASPTPSPAPYWHAASVEFDGFRAAIELGNGIVEDLQPRGPPAAAGLPAGRSPPPRARSAVAPSSSTPPAGSTRSSSRPRAASGAATPSMASAA